MSQTRALLQSLPFAAAITLIISADPVFERHKNALTEDDQAENIPAVVFLHSVASWS